MAKRFETSQLVRKRGSRLHGGKVQVTQGMLGRPRRRHGRWIKSLGL